jgi:hypothetical protein
MISDQLVGYWRWSVISWLGTGDDQWSVGWVLEMISDQLFRYWRWSVISWLGTGDDQWSVGWVMEMISDQLIGYWRWSVISWLDTLQRRINKLIILTFILPTWRIWWAPNNASRWQMGFNFAFKGLICFLHVAVTVEIHCYWRHFLNCTGYTKWNWLMTFDGRVRQVSSPDRSPAVHRAVERHTNMWLCVNTFFVFGVHSDGRYN